MKTMAFLGKSLLVTGTVAAGLSTGGWVGERSQSPSAYRQSFMETGEEASPAALPPATTDSLFHYQFVSGERLEYALDATIGGSGIESLAGPGNVAMEFSSDMYVETLGVDLAGNGDLLIGFDTVEMRGSFMDAPVNLMHSLGGTEFNHGNSHISTAQGDSIAGIPQLEFFNKPTRAEITPAGDVLNVFGAPGMDRMLSPEKLVASVRFPDGDLDEGAQWISEFAMPVPGIGSPVASQATNVLEGFELYRGRYCGVIRQTIQAKQEAGTAVSPESVLGDEMNFSLPEFKLSGENLIYFDIDNGQLIQADMNLDFSLRIGDQLKPVADMLSLYGELLNEIEGNDPGEKGDAGLLDLGLNITGTLSLVTQ